MIFIDFTYVGSIRVVYTESRRSLFEISVEDQGQDIENLYSSSCNRFSKAGMEKNYWNWKSVKKQKLTTCSRTNNEEQKSL